MTYEEAGSRAAIARLASRLFVPGFPLLPHLPDRHAYFGHETLGVGGQSLVDERDLTREPGDLETMLPDIAHDCTISFRGVAVTAAESDAHAFRFRQFHGLAPILVLVVEQQEHQTVIVISSLFQILGRHTHADIAEENHRIVLPLLQTTD